MGASMVMAVITPYKAWIIVMVKQEPVTSAYTSDE
jgi:hypothetical protein